MTDMPKNGLNFNSSGIYLQQLSLYCLIGIYKNHCLILRQDALP